MKRIVWLDYTKAFGIFLVVYGHSLATSSYVDKWIYSFHMPLFFLISGYLTKEKYLQRKFVPFIVKNLKALLPAYCFFFIVGYIMWLFILRNFGVDANKIVNPVSPILAFFYGTGKPDTIKLTPVVLWFFPCLFSSQILFYICSRCGSNLLPIFSFLLMILGFIIPRDLAMPFQLETAFVAQAYLVLGFKLKNKIGKFENHYKIWFILFLLIGTSCAFLNERIEMLSSVYGNIFLFLGSSILISLAFMMAFQKLPSSQVIKLIAKNTIIIFPLHPIIFSFFAGCYVFILNLPLNVRNNTMIGLVASILNILVILAIVPLIKKNVPWIYGLK
ncbi:acyltransferase family protein [Desulfoplanes sp. PS50]